MLIPSKVLLEMEVKKIVAEAEDGSFGILPHHIDCVAALVPGILAYQPESGEEQFAAIDSGIIVKQGDEVFVSTTNAVIGAPLGELQKTVEEEFETLDDREKMTLTALAKLEANFIRRFIEIQK